MKHESSSESHWRKAFPCLEHGTDISRPIRSVRNSRRCVNNQRQNSIPALQRDMRHALGIHVLISQYEDEYLTDLKCLRLIRLRRPQPEHKVCRLDGARDDVALPENFGILCFFLTWQEFVWCRIVTLPIPFPCRLLLEEVLCFGLVLWSMIIQNYSISWKQWLVINTLGTFYIPTWNCDEQLLENLSFWWTITHDFIVPEL